MGRTPNASSPEVSERMRRAKTCGTGPELAVRRLLFAKGFRYRVQARVPGLSRRTIDVAFPGKRLAVFIDGCFWHGCSRHRTVPKNNHAWWLAKLIENRQRDRDTDKTLTRMGWRVLRFWEHDDPARVVATIQSTLKARRAPLKYSERLTA
jgi:DNA mismatch endonuclease (patch repair protein)